MAMITLSIDVSLLNKDRFKRITRKNGNPAVFANLVAIESKAKPGEWFIKESATQEERLNGLQLPIIGNAKTVGVTQNGGSNRVPAHQMRQPAPQQPSLPADADDDIPY